MFEHYKGLAHITLRTMDMERSVEFYEKIGGTAVKADILGTVQGERMLMIVEFAGLNLELIQVFEPVEGIPPRFAVYVDNLDEAVAEIKAAGIDSFASPRRIRMKALGGRDSWILRGPDGEEIELVQLGAFGEEEEL